MSVQSRVAAGLAALVLSLSVFAVAFAGEPLPGTVGASPPASSAAAATASAAGSTSAAPAASSSAAATEPAPAIAEPAPAAAPAPAEPAPAEKAKLDDRLRVYVLIFSPGDHPFYKFGHNAIWIHDESKPPQTRDKVYNWGTFSFGDPALIPKFFQGRFMYWLSIQGIGATQYVYKRENRSITAQELNLDYAQKRELQRLVDENARPENKYYKYDYYRDNCSTRVRDLVDKVTDGAIKKVTSGPARLTYRDHTLRLTESMPAEYVVLDLVMGDFIDQPMTEWDEGFIPMEFQASARKATLVDADGVERPLVKREWVLLPSVQTPPPADPPVWWPYSLVAGLVFGALFALSGRAGSKNKLARVFFGLMLALFGLVAGFFGIFFLAAWAFTDHVVGYHNENMLLCVPWAIWLVGTGPRLAFGRAKSMIVANKLLSLTLAATVLDLVLKVTPWFDQKNGFFLVFFIPLWAGAVVGARALAAHARTALAVAGAGATKATTPAARKKGDASGTDETLKAEKSDAPSKPSPSMKPSKVERKPAKKSTPSDAKVDANAETKSEAKRASSKKEIITGLEETVAAGDLEATKKAGGADLDATKKSESEPPPAAD